MAEENKEEFLGYPSFQEFSQTLLKNVVQCTKASNEMAKSHDDHEFWTSFEQYKDFCAAKGTEVLNLIGEVLHHQGLQCQWSEPSAKRYPHNDIEERFENLIEANDMLLERIDSQLDEIANPSKANKPIVSATAPMTVSVVSTWNKQTNRKKEKSEMWKKFNLITARNIQRPQLKWKTKVDNSNAPFVPILKVKPNAIKEWRPAQRFREMGTRIEVSSIVDDFIHQQRMGEDFDMFEDRHPYKFELDAFEPIPWQLEEGSIIPYKSLEETSLTIIDDIDQLKDLLEKLKMVKEIAIDLEHHSYRSFLGFVCLMQISTRQEDFLVDTISLREDLHILNEVFTDPNILKVLHGADKDIEWLQRDFGLYIVNMFDTGQASKVLQLSRNSLAFLLKQYCEIDANKQYQLADWRLRPIPDEMVKYAREDTHYLLYIYDKMRTMLLEIGNGQPNLIKAVYSMSKGICSKIYEKPIFTPDSYLDICNKYKKHLNGQQLECLKLLVAWRDRTAREEDESYGYVIPNHMMIRIAEQLPREPEGVLACCNPIPPLVRQNVAEIYILVKQARAFDSRMLARSDESSSQHRQNADKQMPPKSMLVETLEGGDYYSSALSGFELYPVTGPPIKKLAPSISFFLEEPMTEEKTENEKKARFIMDSFRSPFELYLPRANTAVAQPEEINNRWKEASIPTSESVESPVRGNEKKTDQATWSEDNREKSPPKRKVLEISKNELTKTLRDELPKKRKKETIVVDSTSGSESPVQFSYEKAATGPAFVPFDYSKAKIKTEPTSGKSNGKKGEHQLGGIIEEPLKKGVVRDSKKLQKSGSRSMTFKQ